MLLALADRLEHGMSWRLRRSRCLLVFCSWLVLLLELLADTPASAAEPNRWLADHLALDGAAVASFRVALGDDRNPGFQTLGGGGELNLGLEFDSGFGFLLGGRALRLPNFAHGATDSFMEASGHLSAQFRLSDWVRMGLGASVGRFWRCCGDSESPLASSLLAGGFLRIGVDFLPRNANLFRALGLWLRIDLDGHPLADSRSVLPTMSMAMTLGLGFRL
jgi:hypothetical protein